MADLSLCVYDPFFDIIDTVNILKTSISIPVFFCLNYRTNPHYDAKHVRLSRPRQNSRKLCSTMYSSAQQPSTKYEEKREYTGEGNFNKVGSDLLRMMVRTEVRHVSSGFFYEWVCAGSLSPAAFAFLCRTLL